MSDETTETVDTPTEAPKPKRGRPRKSADKAGAGESGGEAKAEAKPEASSEPKSEAKGDAKPDTGAEAKSEGKAEGGDSNSGGGNRGGGNGGQNKGGGGQQQQQKPGKKKRRRRRKKRAPKVFEASYQPDPELEEIDLWDLQDMDHIELIEVGEDMEIEDPEGLRRHDLTFEIMKAYGRALHKMRGRGTLEVLPDGFGFLRSGRYNYLPCQEDVYVPPKLIRSFGLRSGDMIEAELRPPKDSKERFLALMRIELLNGCSIEDAKKKIPFEQLTPLFPDDRAVLENSEAKKDDVSMRVVDLVTPVGFGQRALIVAPPRTGKTVLMQKMANAMSANNPEARLIILLVDERPEEVTDMQRNTKAEVVSSTFDEPPDRHVQVAEIVIEMAKRDVENGKDVVILLDSITRLARAYNTVAPHSGKILTGGVDANALHKPKRFFGAARNIENGGSLTIIATALVETGSRMDEVIFEEFKGTGNMELHLDRSLVDKRVYPAINIERSGTRKEENLLHPDELQKVWVLRKALSGVNSVEAMELLIGRLKKFNSNAEFLMGLQN